MDLSKPFWRAKTLEQMSVEEWESLCDGCGLCCVIRFEDEVSGEIVPTRVHCKLFDSGACGCSNYPDRKLHVPDCIKLTPYNIQALGWMPRSCAYRRIHEGKDLPRWHPLVTGDPESVHAAGVSVRGKTISEEALAYPEDAVDFEAPEWLEDQSGD